MEDDPFAVLGLPALAGLTDDEVRAAWRRIAAATHPDREDGGDPARFGAAAAAYVLLRTSYGRGEALADLAASGRPDRARRRSRAGRAGRAGRARAGTRRAGSHRLAAQPSARGLSAPRLGSLSHGRALGWPVTSAAAVAAATIAAVGVTPATIGLLAGALTVTGWALWRRAGGGQ